MPTRNVNLSDRYDAFIDTSIAEGRFSNASEAVRAGLHLLERQAAEDKARIEWLRGAVQQGVDAMEHGDYTVLNTAEDIDAIMDDIRREVRTEQSAGQTIA